MSLKSLIEKRIDRLESVPDKLQSVIDTQNEVLFKQLLKELNALKIVDGKIEASRANLAKVTGIIEKLKRTLFGKDYVDALKEFATEIGVQAQINNDILKETVNSFSDSEMFKAAVQNSQKNALLLFDESAVNVKFAQPISQILSNSIIQNVSFQDAVRTLRESMVGENAVYSKYAKTIVKDAFSISDRQYNDLISRENGIEFFRYDGGKIKTTRYFCCVRSNNIYHRKEIESWGDKESLWNNPKDGACENAKSGGRNENTNSATIFSYLGGYNCLHVLVPIATDYVPAEDKARAKANGWYIGS